MLATRDFHVSALSPDGAHIWILMGIFLWFLCICCLLPHHCFCFQELAENFVPSGRHVKLARVKVWSPGSSFQTYLVFSLRCQNVDKGFLFFFLFFCLQSFVGHIFALKSPERILFIAVQSKPWRGESFFLTDLYMCDHLFDLCSCWHAYVKANILLRCLWAECRAVLCLPKQSSLLSS